MVLAAPERGRERVRRGGWGEAPEHLEELPRETLGCEVGHTDRAARAAHAKHLVRDRLVVGGEHGAERRRDDVERVLVERQRLGVGLDPLERDPAVAASRRPASKFSGVRSEATTRAPASAARIATFPVPAATSSTRWPAEIPQASTNTGPTSHTVAFANRW